MQETPTVLVIEDDDELRKSIEFILRSTTYRFETFGTPKSFLDQYDPDQPGCVVVDLMLPELNGLQVLDEIEKRGGHHPFIVITAYGSVPEAINVLKREEAIDFI